MTKSDFEKRIHNEMAGKKPEKEEKINKKSLAETVTSLIHSENKYVEDFLDMTIKDFCKSDKNLYYTILGFTDDYQTFMNCGYNFSTLKSLAVKISEILATPEKYIDYDSRDAYRAYLDTDGMTGCPVDNSEKLIRSAEYIIRTIMYLPYERYAG